MGTARACVLFLASIPLWAQATLTVSGAVTDSTSGLPLENAAVSLGDRMKFTDGAGRFIFDEVAPGDLKVDVHILGYVDYSKAHPDEPTVRIEAGKAEHDFRMLPFGKITGRIIGEDKDALRTVNVTVWREDFTDGIRHFAIGAGGRLLSGVQEVPDHSGSVDPETGAFAVSGLVPGRYLLTAQLTSSRAGVFIALGSTRTLDPRNSGDKSDTGIVRTYFPGSAEFEDAVPIEVRPGESQIVDFKLQRRPLFHVSGRVALPGVAAEGGTITAYSMRGAAGSWSAPTSAEGHFDLKGLPPGDYSVGTFVHKTGLPLSFAMTTLDTSFSVTTRDIEGLQVGPLNRPPVATVGKFEMANGDPLPKGLGVQYAYPDPGGRSDLIPVADTGEFWLNGAAGEYSVLPVLPPGYAATAARYGSGNYVYSLVALSGDAPLAIVLTNHPGAVSGALLDDRGAPIAAKIALVPDPLSAGFDWRAIRVTRPDDHGIFSFNGLAPGRYKAVALTGDEQKQDHDLAVIGPKLAVADAVEVGAGQTATVRVKR